MKTRIAKTRGLTVSEWVRRAPRQAASAEPVIDRDRKLAAIRVGAACSFPTADVDIMLAEIEQGRSMGVDAG